MRSFTLTTLLLALACVSTRAQFSFPATQSSLGANNRYPRNPAQQQTYGASNPNSIDSFGSRYPAQAGLGNGVYGAGRGSYPGQAGIGASPATATNGNPNNRILGLLGGGGGGGGLFSNLIGALTGRNRNPGAGGFGGGAYPYPVPAPYPGYSPYGPPPSPYGGGFGYPGFGGGYYG
ncbi:uncharacterized protein LOC105219182 [Zeugodacus cucurbitae]|nr:uncharacterized protein LOC105219182 [Zeugodacus cucurbitae]